MPVIIDAVGMGDPNIKGYDSTIEVGAYDIGFGAFGVKSETAYVDPYGSYLGAGVKSDLRNEIGRQMELGIKAFNTQTGGAGTAGYATIPVYVDPLIVDQSRKYTPLVEGIIPKVANRGITADFNVITAKGAAKFLAEDPALAEQDDTLDRSSKAIKYAYAVGRVTGQSIVATPPYSLQQYNPQGAGLPGTTFGSSAAPNSKQLSVLVKSRAIMELLENKILNGDSSSDANEIDGIRTQMGATNTVDKNSTQWSLKDVDTAVSNAFTDGGRVNVAITDPVTYAEAIQKLRDGQRYPPTNDLFGVGRIVFNTMVGEVPLIPSQFATTTDGSRRIDFLDTSVWEQRYLLDVTYQDLAMTGDAEKFMLKSYMALICRSLGFNSSITEISV